MSRHLSVNSIITPLQHGFQRGLSCDTQLISVTHEWAKVLNIHGQVDVIFLDFAKAFDSVPHEKLLLKARHYGIRGKLNEWLRDFLSDRWQRVVVNGSCSEWSNVSSGVPQGTVLGPVLFLLYINDLPTGISSEVKLFADDTVLLRQICYPDDHHRLQHDLHQLEQWAARWQMTLRSNSSHFSYRLNDTHLEEVKYYKYLGVYITSSLSWSLQCEEVKKKANKILCVRQWNLSSRDRAIKSRAYASLVRPIAE